MSLYLFLATSAVSAILYFIYRAWRVTHYWQERGVPHVKPWMFIGNSAQIVFARKSGGQLMAEICAKFPNDPYVGFYDFMTPIILVNNLELIEKILIKDFLHFSDHGFNLDTRKMPFESNLFLMGGKRWKAIRKQLSPLFTTGKLKEMFDTMKQCGDNLVEVMGGNQLQGIDMKNLLSRFTMDVIGSCAFGIDAKAIKQPENNEFFRMARKTFEMDLMQFMKLILVTAFTPIAQFFNITFNKRDVRRYFCNVIDETLNYRREHEYKRNDFVQLMMQLQDKGYVEIHTKDPADDYLNIDHNSYSTEKFELSNEELTGHAFSFLTAGFDTTKVTIIYSLYELAKHPQLQEKVREEILREMNKGSTVTYDTIKEMTYLEQCVKETLRKHGPATTLMRACTKEYTLPNGLTIDAGQRLMIISSSVHYNPKYYPDPERFDPDRFDPVKNLPSIAFLPFGNGPRICIAMRFAMLEVKYCLAKLLMKYSFRISNKTKEPLAINPRSLFNEPKEKIFFNVTRIE